MSINTEEFATQITNKGVIQLSGAERVKYLQGQVTADIEQLTEQHALLTCHCDFKGKIWSVFQAVSWQDSILLLPHHSVLDKSLAELNKYGVFAKVEITNQSDNWTIIGGKGPSFEKTVIDLFGELPTSSKNAQSNEFGIVLFQGLPERRFLVLQPTDTANKLHYQLDGTSEQWDLEDIKGGIADVREQNSNEFVPQMLNLQYLAAIDFEKGCYMGQEVIARTKYLGRNKKAGFVLKGPLSKTDLTGELLEFEIEGNWRPGGKILTNASANNETWLFAVLANDTLIPSNFRLKSMPNILFVTQELPYDIQLPA